MPCKIAFSHGNVVPTPQLCTLPVRPLSSVAVVGKNMLRICGSEGIGMRMALPGTVLMSITGGFVATMRHTRKSCRARHTSQRCHHKSRKLCAAAVEVPLDSQNPGNDHSRRFRHFDPEWPLQAGIYFDGRRAPLVFALAESEQLTAYIRSDPLGPFAQELIWPDAILSSERQAYENETDAPCAPGQWTAWGFQFSGKEQYLLKADWHTVNAWGNTCNMFAPRKGANTPCQMAPPRILAFMEAFRAVNEACWQKMVDGIQTVKAECTNKWDEQRLLSILLNAFEQGGHFAAVEVQAGPSLENHNMSWHRDGVSSLLHLAITLGGSRTIQFRSPNEMHEVQLGPGSFYLSSPFLFDHGVRYARAGKDTGPLLTLMCRFGFLNEKDTLWAGGEHGPRMHNITEIIATCLKDAIDANEFRLPTLQEVRAWEKDCHQLPA